MAVEATVNRLLHPWYPDTVHEVLYQVFNGRYEYTSAPLLASAEPTAEHYEAVHAALCGPGVLPDALPDGRTAVFFGREPQNQYIAATSRFHTFCYEYPTP